MIRTLTLVLMLAVASSAAEKRPAKAAPKSGPPAGAVKVTDTQYRHTDAKGKKWVYLKTPFGWSKVEETAAAPTAPPAEQAQIRVVSDGDIVTFEKASPFGVSRWERKKDDLTADEQSAVARFREKRAAQE